MFFDTNCSLDIVIEYAQYLKEQHYKLFNCDPCLCLTPFILSQVNFALDYVSSRSVATDESNFYTIFIKNLQFIQDIFLYNSMLKITPECTFTKFTPNTRYKSLMHRTDVNIAPQNTSIDLKYFKNLTKLELNRIPLRYIANYQNFISHLETLSLNHSNVGDISQIIQLFDPSIKDNRNNLNNSISNNRSSINSININDNNKSNNNNNNNNGYNNDNNIYNFHDKAKLKCLILIHGKLTTLTCHSNLISKNLQNKKNYPNLGQPDKSYAENLNNLLQPFIELTHLDLSNQTLRSTSDFVEYLPQLQSLNLGFNQLTTIPNFHLNAQANTLTVLVLKDNKLEGLQGIEKLSQLSHLDISRNVICVHENLSPLKTLKHLKSLNTRGNPFSYHPYSRQLTSAYIHPAVFIDHQPVATFWLNGKSLSKQELMAFFSSTPLINTRTLKRSKSLESIKNAILGLLNYPKQYESPHISSIIFTTNAHQNNANRFTINDNTISNAKEPLVIPDISNTQWYIPPPNLNFENKLYKKRSTEQNLNELSKATHISPSKFSTLFSNVSGFCQFGNFENNNKNNVSDIHFNKIYCSNNSNASNVNDYSEGQKQVVKDYPKIKQPRTVFIHEDNVDVGKPLGKTHEAEPLKVQNVEISAEKSSFPPLSFLDAKFALNSLATPPDFTTNFAQYISNTITNKPVDKNETSEGMHKAHIHSSPKVSQQKAKLGGALKRDSAKKHKRHVSFENYGTDLQRAQNISDSPPHDSSTIICSSFKEDFFSPHSYTNKGMTQKHKLSFNLTESSITNSYCDNHSSFANTKLTQEKGPLPVSVISFDVLSNASLSNAYKSADSHLTILGITNNNLLEKESTIKGPTDSNMASQNFYIDDIEEEIGENETRKLTQPKDGELPEGENSFSELSHQSSSIDTCNENANEDSYFSSSYIDGKAVSILTTNLSQTLTISAGTSRDELEAGSSGEDDFDEISSESEGSEDNSGLSSLYGGDDQPKTLVKAFSQNSTLIRQVTTPKLEKELFFQCLKCSNKWEKPQYITNNPYKLLPTFQATSKQQLLQLPSSAGTSFASFTRDKSADKHMFPSEAVCPKCKSDLVIEIEEFPCKMTNIKKESIATESNIFGPSTPLARIFSLKSFLSNSPSSTQENTPHASKNEKQMNEKKLDMHESKDQTVLTNDDHKINRSPSITSIGSAHSAASNLE